MSATPILWPTGWLVAEAFAICTRTGSWVPLPRQLLRLSLGAGPGSMSTAFQLRAVVHRPLIGVRAPSSAVRLSGCCLRLFGTRASGHDPFLWRRARTTSTPSSVSSLKRSGGRSEFAGSLIFARRSQWRGRRLRLPAEHLARCEGSGAVARPLCRIRLRGRRGPDTEGLGVGVKCAVPHPPADRRDDCCSAHQGHGNVRTPSHDRTVPADFNRSSCRG